MTLGCHHLRAELPPCSHQPAASPTAGRAGVTAGDPQRRRHQAVGPQRGFRLLSLALGDQLVRILAGPLRLVLAAVLQPQPDLGRVHLRVELYGEVLTKAERLDTELALGQHPGAGRRQAPVMMKLQPRARLDQGGVERLDRRPADLAARRRLHLAAQRRGQRLGAEADAEHRDTGRVGRPEPVQLVADPAADPLLVDRPDRAEHDDVVHSVEWGQRPALRELVHDQLSPAGRERIRDVPGFIDRVMAQDHDSHRRYLSHSGVTVSLSGNEAVRAHRRPPAGGRARVSGEILSRETASDGNDGS